VQTAQSSIGRNPVSSLTYVASLSSIFTEPSSTEGLKRMIQINCFCNNRPESAEVGAGKNGQNHAIGCPAKKAAPGNEHNRGLESAKR